MRAEIVWLLQAMEGLLGSVDGSTEMPAPAGCSAVAIRGQASAGGRPVIAHNFDYLPTVQPFYTVRESRPRTGFRSVEFTAAPLAGAIDGVNEKGLAVTYNYAQTIDQAAAGPTISMRVSEVLGAAVSVDEAITMITTRRRWGSGLLMLADASGAIASVELANTRTEVRRPADGADFLFQANKFVCPATAEVEVSPLATYNHRAPRPLRGHRVLDSSLCRMKRFAQLLDQVHGLTPGDLGKVMADHAGGEPSDATICMHSDYWFTTACVQCLPDERTIRVAFAPACAAA